MHALAALDSQAIFDGGRLLPLGQEAAWTDLAALYRELPEARFASYSQAPQPLTIRTLSWRGKTYLYVVNDCGWVSEAKLSLRLPAGSSPSPLGFTPAPSDAPAKGGEWEWTIELAPYSAAGLMLNSNSAWN